MKKRILLLTGNPGIGKTTVLLKILEDLKVENYRIGGMISREVSTYGVRVGFEIFDLDRHRRGWLAHINQKTEPHVGKYGINLKDLDDIGVNAITNAVEGLDIVAIDEIGPMELLSEKFREAVRKAVESRKLVVCIVHHKARNRLIDELKARDDAQSYTVDLKNRDNLHRIIIDKAIECLREPHTGLLV